MMTALAVTAVCAAVLGVLAAAGLGRDRDGNGRARISGARATGAVALVCALSAVWFVFRLRALARHALFARSRQQLRGDA
jgi:hypothetical protein